MRRSVAETPLTSIFAYIVVYFLQGAKEPGKLIDHSRRSLQILAEVTQSELSNDGDGRRSHGPVLVRALSPHNLFLFINPNGETHSEPHSQYDVSVL